MTDLSALHGKFVPGHRNLQFWGKTGFIRVCIKVPNELKTIIGRSWFYHALGTPCVAEAVRRARRPLADIQETIDRAWHALGKAKRPISLAVPYAAVERQGLASVMVGAWLAGANHLQIESDAPMPLPGGYTYEQGLRDWVASKGSQPPKQASQDVYRSHLRRFFAWLGHNEMGRVTRQDVIAYPEILLAGSDAGRKLDNKSVNNNMASIRAVFRVAVEKEKISADPTDKAIKKLPVSRKSSRDDIDLDRVLPAAMQAADPVIRWLWMLGILTGARMNEFTDATVSAVREVHGQHCLVIGKKYRIEARDTKTEDSERIVPLHSALIRAGFLSYVETIRSTLGDNAPLFPQLKPNNYGTRSDDGSNKANAWLRNVVGIKDPNMVFHSCRHTFKTIMRNNGIGEEIHDAITGHVGGGVGRTYGKVLVARMAEAIETIEIA